MLRLVSNGGLGNQLFEYAAVRAQAKRIGVGVEIDTRFYDQDAPKDSKSFWLQTLPIKARILRYQQSGPFAPNGFAIRMQRKVIMRVRRRYDEKKIFDKDPNFFKIGPNTVIRGFFQSLFYLLPRDEEIIAELDPWHAASPPVLDHTRAVAAGNFVSVHVRRTDYLDYKGFEVTEFPKYVAAAMELARSRLGQPRFLVFSDDIAWCKEQEMFQRQCDFIETNRFGANPCFDLLLMSSCAHHIIANSTFSWWAAWFSYRQDKLCILPKHWIHGLTAEAIGLIAPGWVVI